MSQYLIVGIAMLFLIVFLAYPKFPMGIVCLTSVVFLWLTGVLSLSEAFGNFVSSSIITMVAMMVLGAGLVKTNLIRNTIRLVSKTRANNIHMLLLISILASFFLAQFTGAVTALMLLVPLLVGLANSAGIPGSTLILPASVAAQAAMGLLPIGNGLGLLMMKNTILENLGLSERLGLWTTTIARGPGVLAMMIFIVVFGPVFLPKRTIENDAFEVKEIADSTLSPMKEKCAYIIFIATMITIIFNSKLPLDATQLGVIGALAMIFTGVLDEQEALKSITWPVVFAVASMLSVVTALSNSGIGDLLANAFGNVVVNEHNGLLGSLLIVLLLCLVITQFMENQSLSNIMTPICCLSAVAAGMNPIALLMGIDASCLTSIVTPMGSAASACAYGLGKYSMKEMIKFGVPCALVGVLTEAVWLSILYG